MRIVFIILVLAFVPENGLAQTNLDFEVNKVLPYISITKKNLQQAKTLSDLDKNYKAEWVKEYVSVEILAYVNGEINSAMSSDDQLSKEQKDLMLGIDSNTDVKVKVLYIPDNNLSQNDTHLNDFTFSVDPDKEAEYPGGKSKLLEYLEENAIRKIPNDSFQGYDFSAVKFTVSAEGEIINVHMFDMSPFGSAKDEQRDVLLMEAIRKMPCWKPAEYADGLKVEQEYVFSVGNHENCVVPILCIREY